MILSHLSRKFGQKYRKSFEICISTSRGGAAQIGNLLNLVEKSMETCQFLKIFMNYEIFYISKSISKKKIKAC